MNPIITKGIDKLALLSKQHRVENLYVFGSVTTNRFTSSSDIDFLVEFQPMDFGDYTDNYFQFCVALEALFGRKVDLTTTRSLSNPYFIESVDKTKKLVYSANRDKKAVA
ncbi:MAG: nucleotidyltransferase domain-containing protein [Imperialibacter sp.]|uniref:nucleotidyltransferase family protein n=1 Tax=Imperialibacter sp. TaxID=2038411 RepID=UPI0032EB8E8D